VQKLKLDVTQLVPMHGRPVAWSFFVAAAKSQN
jgi:hypothetical protein